MTTETSTQSKKLIDDHDAFLSPNYPRYDCVMSRGDGHWLWDEDGKKYLDLFAGFGAPVLGHCHPDLVSAVSEQASQLWHVGNLFHTKPQIEAARHISEKGFGGKSFFCHSGADSNDAALKVTRLYGVQNPGPAGARFKIISALRSFHGRSFGTMSATANPAVRDGFAPLPEGYAHVPYNDIGALKEAVDDQTVAILLEPIQGEGGVHVPDNDYFKQVRALCDEKDLLLISDEVWTGCGRTGKWFGYQHWGIEPDIITLGKGVGGGLAVGVMCLKPALCDLVDPKVAGGVKHATTLGGNCLAMAVTAKLFEVMERDDLVFKADALGESAKKALQVMLDDVEGAPLVDIRGRGLFLGVQLNESIPAGEVVKKAMDQGILLNATQGNTLRIAPPVTIDEATLVDGLSQVAQIIVSSI